MSAKKSNDSIDSSNQIQSPPTTLGATLLRLGPGMIIAGSIVGSGELIATTKVGAVAGFSLLWLIILGCIIKVFAQVEFGRYTVTHGETSLKAMDSLPGPRKRVHLFTWVWLIVSVLILTQQGGIVGAIGQSLSITKPLTAKGELYNDLQDQRIGSYVQIGLLQRKGAAEDDEQIVTLQNAVTSAEAELEKLGEPNDPYIWGIVVSIGTAVLLYFGKYGLIQALSTFFVGIFTVMTIVTVIIMQTKPDWRVTTGEFLDGLSFGVPEKEAGKEHPVAIALMAYGIIGVGAIELLQYPYWCMEKGYAKSTGPNDGTKAWKERAAGWMRVMRFDAWLSMVVYTFATVAFFLLGASVLGRTGLDPEKGGMVRTLAEMYVPVFGGEWATWIFLFGAISVLYSTFFVAAAGNARMVSDGLGLFGLHDGSEKSKAKWTRIFSVIWPLVAVLTFCFFQSPAAMVLLAGAGQTIMLPMIGVAALYFRFKRCDDALKPGRVWDVMLAISVLGFFVTALWFIWTKMIAPLIAG